VPTFADREFRVVSATDPFEGILGFLDWILSPYFSSLLRFLSLSLAVNFYFSFVPFTSISTFELTFSCLHLDSPLFDFSSIPPPPPVLLSSFHNLSSWR
jgi:hypothetical protein